MSLEIGIGILTLLSVFLVYYWQASPAISSRPIHDDFWRWTMRVTNSGGDALIKSGTILCFRDGSTYGDPHLVGQQMLAKDNAVEVFLTCLPVVTYEQAKSGQIRLELTVDIVYRFAGYGRGRYKKKHRYDTKSNSFVEE